MDTQEKVVETEGDIGEDGDFEGVDEFEDEDEQL